MTSAVLYARVSTDRQADDGLPIESQLEQCARKAAALGATVLRTFVDAGISGSTDARPAFQDAIAYCRAHRVDWLVTWSTSRFARNKIDAALYKRQLDRAGVKLAYCTVDIDRNTDSGWLLESMLEVMDEHYSRQIRADTLRSMQQNARAGHWNGGHVPYGYQVVDAERRKRLQPHPDEAPIVRDVFRRYLAGAGAKAIAQELNAAGLLHRGRPWSKNAVAYLLKSPVYAGRLTFGRTDRRNRRERPPRAVDRRPIP